jgi:hypothetical protein
MSNDYIFHDETNEMDTMKKYFVTAEMRPYKARCFMPPIELFPPRQDPALLTN